MRISILSSAPRSFSTKRLVEACRKRDHQARVLSPLAFSICVAEEEPSLFFMQKKLSGYDAVIPRIAPSLSAFGIAVVRQFEQLGYFCLNPSHAISVSRDKLRALQVLSRHNIGIPPSTFVHRKEDIVAAIDEVGGAPVIIKLLQGTQGVGVMLAETTKGAEAIIEALQLAQQHVLIQKFVAESRGRDIRAFVVGDRVVAAMRRTAQANEFRSNVHRGGKAEKVKLDLEFERTALHASHILGLRVAGVDMLESNDGPKVMEVNSSPGLEAIEESTGVDVAGEIISYLEEQIQFPDIDVRERLSLAKGFCIVEFTISKESELSDQTIAEAKLNEREIQVLQVTRSELLHPAPPAAFRFRQGDSLLCYGKKLALERFLPSKGPSTEKSGIKRRKK